MPEWTQFATATSGVALQGVEIGSDGTSYVSGCYSGDFVLAGLSRPAATACTMFVASLTSTGDARWLNTYAGNIVDPRTIAIAPDGHLLLGGELEGSVSLDGYALDSIGVQSPLLIEMQPDGAVAVAIRYLATNANSQVHGLDVAPNGLIALSGLLGSSLELGGTLSTLGDDDPFVAVLDRTLVPRWRRGLGGIGKGRSSSAAIDGDGNSCFVGTFEGELDLGDGVVSSRGDADAYVVSYRADGSLRWTHAFGSPGTDRALHAIMTSQGDCIIVGIASGPIDVGGTIATSGGQFAFVVRYDSRGRVVWSGAYGSTVVGATMVARGDELVVFGAFSGTSELGRFVLSATGGTDLFVMLLESGGNVRGALALGGIGDELPLEIDRDPATGAFVAAGRFTGETTLGTETRTQPVVSGFAYRFHFE